VRESAAELRLKRELAASNGIKSPSKIKQNLKVQKQLRAKSATEKAKRAQPKTPAEGEEQSDGMNKLI